MEIQELFKSLGVLVHGHFVYASQLHGGVYVNKNAIYPYTQHISRLCLQIAEAFKSDGVEVVLGPALGGIVLSQWVAHHLSDTSGAEILAVYAEKTGEEEFVLKRGYDQLVSGRRVLVVEDILTTGSSVRKVTEVVRAAGAEIVGVGALINRGKVRMDQIGVIPKMVSVLDLDLEAWTADDCPLCRRAAPVNPNYGRGREFLAKQVG